MTNPNNMRIPPHSLESEKAVLGSIMLRPDALNEIIDTVFADSFYAEKHRMIYKAMLELYNKNEPIDLLSATTKLKEKNQLEAVGGRNYIAELTNSVPASTNVKHYAQIVFKKNVLRRIIEAGEFMAETAFAETSDAVEDILDAVEKKVFAVTNAGGGDKKFVSIKQSLHETWEEIEKLQENKGGLRGVPTGYPSLDNLLAGLQKSDLIILAARPSVGKTTLALDIARNAATKHGASVAIFSLEMSANQLTQRMLAAESKVNAWKLRTGKLSAEQDFTALQEALNELSKAKIFIDDQAGNSIMKMKSVARKMKSEHGLDLIVVDYLQLMMTSKNHDSMVNQVTEISRSLKGLARELNVPVLALSQLSRAVESRGGKPRLSDLRDSGSIEQDADVVMFIHREDRAGNTRSDTESNGMTEVLIEKHRNGPLGKADLYFDEKNSTFLPLEKHMEGYTAATESGAASAFNDF
jgi:replicative DNA helicase